MAVVNRCLTVFNLVSFVTLTQTACLAITIILHDAFLHVFGWMLVEAIHLYRMIIIVFGVDKDLNRVYLLIGWGMYSC